MVPSNVIFTSFLSLSLFQVAKHMSQLINIFANQKLDFCSGMFSYYRKKGKIEIRTQFWKKSGNKYLCHAAKKKVSMQTTRR